MEFAEELDGLPDADVRLVMRDNFAAVGSSRLIFYSAFGGAALPPAARNASRARRLARTS